MQNAKLSKYKEPNIDGLIEAFKRVTRRVAVRYPRRGTVSIDGRERLNKEAIEIMREAITTS